MVELDRNRISYAPLEVLEETYKAVRGEDLPSNLTVEAARVKVGMTLMVVEDLIGRLGVPVGWVPRAMTLEDLRARAKMENKTQKLEAELSLLNFPVGSMGYELYKTTAAMKAEKPPAGRGNYRRKPTSSRFSKVRATGAGKTVLQSGSLRHQVMEYLIKQPGKEASVEAMEAALGFACRGHIQKLSDGNHVEIVE